LDPSQIAAQKAKPAAPKPSIPQPKPAAQPAKPQTPPSKPQVQQPAAGGKKVQAKPPTFDPPKVIDDDYFTDEWLFEPPPPEVRSRRHIESILHLSEPKNSQQETVVDGTLRELKRIYENSIKPLVNFFKKLHEIYILIMDC